ncbi:MAG: DUF4148 domain-containing protein [Bacillota bacterium]
MNAKQLIAAVAVFVTAGVTFAADASEYVDFNGFQSTKTRAEVRAALQQAPVAQNKEYVEFTNVASTNSREEVRREAVQATRSLRTENTYFGG